jgi:hypothetical protein
MEVTQVTLNIFESSAQTTWIPEQEVADHTQMIDTTEQINVMRVLSPNHF